MDKKYKISYVGYGMFRDIFRRVVGSMDLPDTEIFITEDALPADIDRAIQEACKEGCEVFISSGANATEFKRRSSLPLVEIQTQLLDYAIAIKKALSIGEKVAVVYYNYTKIPDLRIVEELLGCEGKVIYLCYYDSADMMELIKNSPADVIVGASAENETAMLCGKKHVLAYNGETEAQYAILRARSMAIELRKRMRDNSFIHSIVNYSTSGIIGIDDTGVVTHYNSAAAEIIGAAPSDVLRRHIKKLFPSGLLSEPLQGSNHNTSFMQQNGIPIRVTRIRMKSDARYDGELILLDKAQVNTSLTAEEYPAEKSAEVSQTVFDDIIAHSPIMLSAVSEAKLYAQQDSPVMLVGQASVGKKSFAQCMHHHRNKDRGKTVSIDCAVITDKRAFSYLFGQEDNNRQVVSKGILEMDEHDTLVLENVYFASPLVQQALLKVLKEKSFVRVNGYSPIAFRCKVISLIDEYDGKYLKNKLLPSLYYQLSAFSVRLPPLKDRGEDIHTLFSYFADKNSTFRNNASDLRHPLRTILTSYSWPGNIQELINVSLRFSVILEQQHINTIAKKRRVLIDSIGEDEICRDIIESFGGLKSLKKSSQKMLQVVQKMKDLFSFSNDFIAKELDISRTTIWRMQKQSE